MVRRWVGSSDQTGDSISIFVKESGLVFDVEVVFLKAEDPPSDAGGGSSFDGLTHGVQPAECGVVYNELEAMAP